MTTVQQTGRKGDVWMGDFGRGSVSVSFSLGLGSCSRVSARFILHQRLVWTSILVLRVNSFRQWGHVAGFMVDVDRSLVLCGMNKRRGTHPIL